MTGCSGEGTRGSDAGTRSGGDRGTGRGGVGRVAFGSRVVSDRALVGYGSDQRKEMVVEARPERPTRDVPGRSTDSKKDLVRPRISPCATAGPTVGLVFRPSLLDRGTRGYRETRARLPGGGTRTPKTRHEKVRPRSRGHDTSRVETTRGRVWSRVPRPTSLGSTTTRSLPSSSPNPRPPVPGQVGVGPYKSNPLSTCLLRSCPFSTVL